MKQILRCKETFKTTEYQQITSLVSVEYTQYLILRKSICVRLFLSHFDANMQPGMWGETSQVCI